MLFLTVVPDDFYFIWQLELQLFNFSALGIKAEDIHILISKSEEKALSKHFADFIENSLDKACFFIYVDKRISKSYASSIRPNLIKQHILQFPNIENEIIFYYDTDIIFRELPNFGQLSEDGIWYVSDTRSYLDSRYIKSVTSQNFFNEMCKIIGVLPFEVEKNDDNCGVAQYILKNSTWKFWDKVESDCERLYKLMQSNNDSRAESEYVSKKKKRSEIWGIQSWCADMWALLWNAWASGYETRITSELDFCWPMNSIDHWHNKKILHYSGIINKDDKRYFRKGNYVKYAPYYDNSLKKISKDTCSYPLIELINNYRKRIDENRIELMDITFLIPVRLDSNSRLENLIQVVNFLDKYFKTNIIIAESDKVQKLDSALLPNCCSYFFIQDENPVLFRTYVNNLLIRSSNTPFVAIYDTDVIIPVKQILFAVEKLRSGEVDMIYPYDGSFVSVDRLFKEMFGKILDDELFTLNSSKFVLGTKRSYGGAVIVHRSKYIQAGMENENFTGWGPEDIERQKRMKHLNYKVMRTEGSLFHLPHERLDNSFYQSLDHRVQYMEEYLKVCRMDKETLLKYIENWPWKNN